MKMWISDKVLKLKNEERGIDCSLESLGKINVFCGKNNSGKTTIVKQIEHQVSIEWLSYCINAVKLTSQSDRDEWEIETTIPLANEYIQSHREDISQPLDVKKLFKIIQEHYSYRYQNVDEDEYDAIPLSREEIPDFSPLFASLNYKSSNITLIEAKRNVVPDYDLKSEESRSLLKYLFECKNCLSSDPKRQWYDVLNREFKELSGGYAFDLVMDKKLVSLFFEDAYDGSWYMADAMGLGLRDLLYMMAIASFPDTKVVLLEEPESHLHPELQRRLLSFFSEQEDKLFFITTHSNVFLDLTYVDSLFLVSRTREGIGVENVRERAIIMSELGYLSSDNMHVDVLIITEGKTDIPVFEEFLKKVEEYPLLFSHDIKFLSVGGTNIAQINYEILVKNYGQVVIISDGDVHNKSTREKISELVNRMNKEGVQSIHYIELDGYGIENYFTLSAIKAVYGAMFNQSMLESSLVDDNKFYMDKKVTGINKNEKKFQEIAALLTLEEIRGFDIYEKFVIKIYNICKSIPRKNL